MMTTAKLRVLLVEDSQLLSERLLELLAEIQGVATVAVVTTEADAIAAIQQHQPDAVILDLRLKEGTGFGVMRYINTLQLPPVVVVITNYGLPQYRRQAEALGIRYFLDKSQQFDQLAGIVENIRDQHHHL